MGSLSHLGALIDTTETCKVIFTTERMTSAKTGPAGEWSTVGWACWETPAVFSGLKWVPVSGGIWIKRGKREMRLEERLIPCPAEQASLSEWAHRILDKHMVNVQYFCDIMCCYSLPSNQPPWLPCCSIDPLGTCLPQGLCTCHFHWLDALSL